MRYVEVNDQYVQNILQANKLQESASLNESEFVVEEQYEEDVHACPLCESELDEPIPEENLQECVDYILATINEAQQLAEEYLDDEEYDEELYESDEEEDYDDE